MSFSATASHSDATVDADDLITLIVEQTAPLSRDEVNDTLRALPATLVECSGHLVTHDQGFLLIDASRSGWDVDVADALDGAVSGMMTIVGTEAADVAAVAVRLGCP